MQKITVDKIVPPGHRRISRRGHVHQIIGFQEWMIAEYVMHYAFGRRIPLHHGIVHLNGNKLDNRRTNLAVAPLADIASIEHGYVPISTLKPCITCHQFLPLDQFSRRIGATIKHTINATCDACVATRR